MARALQYKRCFLQVGQPDMFLPCQRVGNGQANQNLRRSDGHISGFRAGTARTEGKVYYAPCYSTGLFSSAKLYKLQRNARPVAGKGLVNFAVNRCAAVG